MARWLDKFGGGKNIRTNPLIAQFSENYHGFWKDYWLFIALFLLALSCDTAGTIYFMLRIGTEAEAHPMIYLVSKILGPVLGPLLSAVAKTVAVVIIAVYLRKFAVYIFITSTIIFFLAAWYNVWGIKLIP